MSLRLERILETLSAGCCANLVYANLFSVDSSQALKDLGLGVYSMAAYTKVAQADFALYATEHAQRSRLFQFILEDYQHTLAANTAGEAYRLEFWRLPNEGDPPDRDVDELVYSGNFAWDGSKELLVPFATSQLATFQEVKISLSCAYDAELLEAKFIAWMHRGGKVVESVVRMEAVWRSPSLDSPIAEYNVNQQLSGEPGVFTWNHTGLPLDPDMATAMSIRVYEEDGTVSRALIPIASWD